MNIIWVNRIILLLFVLSAHNALWSQEININPADSAGKDFSFTFEFMAGASYNLKADNFNSKKLSISPSVRFFWKPDHNLNIGIESTYLLVRRTDFEKIKNKVSASLHAIPIYLIFNMRMLIFDFTGGIGASYMESRLKAFNETSVSTNWHYCFTFGAGISFDVTPSLGAGMEAKLFSLTKTDELVGAGYLKLIYHINY